MKEIIKIDGTEIELQTNAMIPFIYKRNFQRDFFAEVQSFQKEGEVRFEFLYEVTWVCAKIANPETPDFDEWLGQFEFFPLLEYQEKIINLVLGCFSQLKNAQTVTAKKKAPAKK